MLRLSSLALALVLAAAAADLPPPVLFAMDTGTNDPAFPTAASKARLVAELGYEGYAWTGTRPGLEDAFAELEPGGKRVYTLYCGVQIEDSFPPAWLGEVVERLAGHDVVIWLTLRSRRLSPSDPGGDAVAVPLVRGIADAAAARGLSVSLYPHTGFWVERVEDAVRVARACDRPNLGATWNLCHWLRVDRPDNLLPLLAEARRSLTLVTVNGADIDGTGWNTLIQPLDRGDCPVDRFVATLRAHGYTGPFGLQHYGIKGSAEENLRRSRAAWEKITAALAGGRVVPYRWADVAAGPMRTEPPGSRRPLRALERGMRSGDSELVQSLEHLCLAALGDAGTTAHARAELCRLVGRFGSGASVPTLLRQLDHDDMVLPALAALRARESTQVAEALLAGLGERPSSSRIPIIAELGRRRHAPAVAALSEQAGAEDPAVAAAALRALGRVATGPAMGVLSAPLAVPDAELDAVRLQALLASSSVLVQQPAFHDDIRACLEPVLTRPETPVHLRAGALRILAGLGLLPDGVLAAALRSPRPLMVQAAVDAALRELAGAPADEFVHLFGGALPVVQALALRSRSPERRDGVLRLAEALVTSPHADVKVAAVEALGAFGTARHVNPLVACLSDAGRVEERAAAVLTGLSGDDAAAAMLAAAASGPPPTSVTLLRILRRRGIGSGAETVARLARHDEALVRREAVRTLGATCTGESVPVLLDLLVRPGADRDLGEIENAVVRAVKRSDTGALLAALAADEALAPPARARALRLLASVGYVRGLPLVAAAARGADPVLRTAGQRALIAWPDPAALPIAVELQQQITDPRERVLLTKGCLRLFSLDTTAAPGAALAFCRHLLADAAEDERALALKAIAGVPDSRALSVLEDVLGEGVPTSDWEAAYLALCRRFGGLTPSRTAERLENVAPRCSPAFRVAAREIEAVAAEAAGHITVWHVSPAYTPEARSGSRFDASFPPESAPGTVAWALVDAIDGPFTSFITRGGINLGALLGGTNRCAYLRAIVTSPEARDVVLQAGSDDGIRVWLNGTLVHANDAARPVSLAQDTAAAKLEAGPNQLLVKVTQGSGEWGASVRFRTPDGAPLEDLDVSL